MKHKGLIVLWLALFAYAVWQLQRPLSSVDPEERIGKITKVQNEVMLRTASSLIWQGASRSEIVGEGSTVATGARSATHIRLDSGRTIQLGPRSQIALHNQGKSRQHVIALISGALEITESKRKPKQGELPQKRIKIVAKKQEVVLKRATDGVKISIGEDSTVKIIAKSGKPLANGKILTRGNTLQLGKKAPPKPKPRKVAKVTPKPKPKPKPKPRKVAKVTPKPKPKLEAATPKFAPPTENKLAKLQPVLKTPPLKLANLGPKPKPVKPKPPKPKVQAVDYGAFRKYKLPVRIALGSRGAKGVVEQQLTGPGLILSSRRAHKDIWPLVNKVSPEPQKPPYGWHFLKRGDLLATAVSLSPSILRSLARALDAEIVFQGAAKDYFGGFKDIPKTVRDQKEPTYFYSNDNLVQVDWLLMEENPEVSNFLQQNVKHFFRTQVKILK